MTTMSYPDATAMVDAIARREVSPRELVAAAIARADAVNGDINAIIHPRYEAALVDASSGALAQGPLHGVPIVVKDASITQAGEPYHEGLQVAKEAGYRASTTSWLTQRLIDAGCVIVGRTNVPELCTHTTTEPVAYGPTRNPANLAHSAGGSSGGSAAAVAAGIVPIAHGSDGGGSVRCPASFCGLIGLKPTRGRFTAGPDAGEHWAGLSTEGFITASLRDAALIFDAVAGPHPSDPCQTPVSGSLRDALARPLAPGLRIGLRTRGACGGDPAHREVDAIVRAAAARFAAAGHDVSDASPPALDDELAIAQQGTMVSACVAAELDTWSARLGRPIELDEIEPRNRMSVSAGRLVTGPQFVAAREWLFGWSRRLISWFDDYDLLITPVVTQPPIRIGQLPIAPTADDMNAMRRQLGWLLGAWNVSGQPAISVPGGRTDDGLPIGVHIVARWGREDLLIQAGALLAPYTPDR